MKIYKVTRNLVLCAILPTLFLIINSCTQENPVPTIIPNSLTADFNGTPYSAPATYIINTQTLSGISYNQLVITSVNSNPITLTFSYTNIALSSLTGISYSLDGKGTYALGSNIYQTAKSGVTSATSGSITITSFDNQVLNGSFNFVGSTFTVTNGKLINVKKL